MLLMKHYQNNLVGEDSDLEIDGIKIIVEDHQSKVISISKIKSLNITKLANVTLTAELIGAQSNQNII